MRYHRVHANAIRARSILSGRHAYIDLGIDVDIDLTMVRPDADTGMSRSHCAVGLIRYPKNKDGERRVGYLVYLKTRYGNNPSRC